MLSRILSLHVSLWTVEQFTVNRGEIVIWEAVMLYCPDAEIKTFQKKSLTFYKVLRYCKPPSPKPRLHFWSRWYVL